ncbi:hypothetical protein BHE74_00000228 [Ensete ventricosum]|nr:hypothetical protein GW17_00056240 [Ensete ventricosum]RWW90783.1 hypothetical protein BHE74_00000228 [Ensete ventricosum]
MCLGGPNWPRHVCVLAAAAPLTHYVIVCRRAATLFLRGADKPLAAKHMFLGVRQCRVARLPSNHRVARLAPTGRATLLTRYVIACRRPLHSLPLHSFACRVVVLLLLYRERKSEVEEVITVNFSNGASVLNS